MPLVKLNPKKIYLISNSKIKFEVYKIIPKNLEGKIKPTCKEHNEKLYK